MWKFETQWSAKKRGGPPRMLDSGFQILDYSRYCRLRIRDHLANPLGAFYDTLPRRHSPAPQR